MTPTQREAAERLADDLQRFDGAERESLRDEAAALLRELLAEPVINQQMTTDPAEPVAWQLPGTDSFLTAAAKTHHGVRAEAYTVPLYAATLEFGRGAHAEAKSEYVGELEEIAAGLRALRA